MNEDHLEPEPRSGQELYDYWLDIIDTTKTFVRDRYYDTWQRYLELYRGNHWDIYANQNLTPLNKSSRNPADEITVNLIGPYINQLRSYVFTNDTKIHCNPTNDQEVTSAILQEVAANYEWRRRNYNEQFKKGFIFTAAIGHSILKQVYNIEIDESANPRQDGNLEYRDFIKKDAPALNVVSPFRFLYDLAAPEKNLETARWCCEIVYQDPSFVLNNIRYSSSVRSDIRTGKERPELLKDPYPGSAAANLPEAFKSVFCEYHLLDKKYGKKYIFVQGCKKPVFEGPWDYDYLDGFPYKMMPFIEDPDDWYPIGLVRWIEDCQFELNRTRTAMFHYRRRELGGQYQVEDDVDSSENGEVDKFLQGEKVIKIPKGSRGVAAIQPAQISAETFAVESRIQNDLDRISGISDIMQGIASPGRRSATQDRSRTQFATLRIEGIVSEVDKTVLSIATDLIKHIKANYVMPRVAQIAGPLAEYWGRVTGEPPGPDGKFWKPYTKADIEGEFDVEIETTARPSQDPNVMSANMDRFVNLCMTVAQMGMQGVPLDQPQYTGGVSIPEMLRAYAESLKIPNPARFLPALRIVPPPIQLQTGFQLQQQQQGALPQPSAEPAMPQDQAEVFRQGENPVSEILGRANGGAPQ